MLLSHGTTQTHNGLIWGTILREQGLITEQVLQNEAICSNVVLSVWSELRTYLGAGLESLHAA